MIQCPIYQRKKSLVACHLVGRCKYLEKCTKHVNGNSLNRALIKYVEQNPDKYEIGGTLAKTKKETKSTSLPLLLIPKKLTVHKNFKSDADDSLVEMSEDKLMEKVDAGEVSLSRLDNYEIVQVTNYGRKVVMSLKRIKR